MKVSMNGLRKNLAKAYNTLARSFLDQSISKENLADNIEEIRQYIGTLLCCYEENDSDFLELDIPLIRVIDEEEE